MAVAETIAELPLTALPALPWAVAAGVALLRLSAARGRALAVLVAAMPLLWSLSALALRRPLPGASWLCDGYAIAPEAWWFALAWLALTGAPSGPRATLNPRGAIALVALAPLGLGAATLGVVLAGRGLLERGRGQYAVVVAAALLAGASTLDAWSLHAWMALIGPIGKMSWGAASFVVDGSIAALQVSTWAVALPWALRGVRRPPKHDTLPTRSPNLGSP